MSTVDIPDGATAPAPATPTAGEPPRSEPVAPADDRWLLEERRRDAYRVG